MTAPAHPGARSACLRAYEDVVELRSLVALAAEALPARSRARPWLDQVRLDLLDLAADIVGPLAGERSSRLDAASVRWLRAVQIEAQLMLPADAPSRPWPSGVSAASTRLLLARAAARAAADDVAPAIRELGVDALPLEYLGRLAMLLLTLARTFGLGAGDGEGDRVRSRLRRPVPGLRLLPGGRRVAPTPA